MRVNYVSEWKGPCLKFILKSANYCQTESPSTYPVHSRPTSCKITGVQVLKSYPSGFSAEALYTMLFCVPRRHRENESASLLTASQGRPDPPPAGSVSA